MVEVINLLKDVCKKLGLIDDYVVESGTDNGWTYEKWASGKLTAQTAFDDPNTKWVAYPVSGLYYTNPNIQITTPSMLYWDGTKYNNSCAVNASCTYVGGDNVGWIANCICDNQRKCIRIVLVRNGNANGVYGQLTISGRWKAPRGGYCLSDSWSHLRKRFVIFDWRCTV